MNNEVTYDSVPLGWEDDEHYRLIVSIKDGHIVKSAKVSDGSLRNSKHGQVITQNHIQEYGEEYLNQDRKRLLDEAKEVLGDKWEDFKEYVDGITNWDLKDVERYLNR